MSKQYACLCRYEIEENGKKFTVQSWVGFSKETFAREYAKNPNNHCIVMVPIEVRLSNPEVENARNNKRISK